jgi:hypothetical protein
LTQNNMYMDTHTYICICYICSQFEYVHAHTYICISLHFCSSFLRLLLIFNKIRFSCSSTHTHTHTHNPKP